MNTETITLPHGYTAEIHTDESQENPFEFFDCEPPLLVFHDRRVTKYGDTLDAADLFGLIPADVFKTRAGRRKVLACIPDLSARSYREALRDATPGLLPERAREALESLIQDVDASPHYWSEAIDYFDMLEALANLAGVPCLNTQSNGYSQGDSARLLLLATPDWVTLTGAPEDTHAAQLQAAADLYSAWAWGDVYGVASIHRPDGEEIDDGSCWGFYGSDHEQSGLMDHCLQMVDWDMAEQAKEATRWHDAACRDIVTV